MVNWGALIEVPVGIILLYVAIAIIDPLQDPLLDLLGNEAAFPYGDTTMTLIRLVTLVLGAMVLYSAYRSFREPEQPMMYG